MARILVVDDEKLVRDTIRVMLEFEGYEVVLVHDGQEAIDALHSKFDLVLCAEQGGPRNDTADPQPLCGYADIAMAGGFARDPGNAIG